MKALLREIIYKQNSLKLSREVNHFINCDFILKHLINTLVLRQKNTILFFSFVFLKSSVTNVTFNTQASWIQKIFGSRHATTCLRAYADSEGQIRQRIRAVWSGPSLSANRTIGYYRMYQWRANARMRLWAWVEWTWICAFCACSKAQFR